MKVKHLLAGYATGTLTPEESSALMRAALEDQEIFDAMADDEALRRYLAEPSFRRDLLKATAPRSSLTWWAGAASGGGRGGLSGWRCICGCHVRFRVVSLGQMAVARAPLPLEPPRATAYTCSRESSSGYGASEACGGCGLSAAKDG